MGLADGLVAVIEGLSGFGALGETEDRAYRPGEDMSYGEGYPLGGSLAAEVGVQNDYEFPTEERGFMPDAGDGEDGEQGDQAQGPTDEYEDELMDAQTPDENELKTIIEERRAAIETAIKQRAVQTQRVADLDQQIVYQLEPQYQAALQRGDTDAARQIGTRMRVLNIQRQAAVQQALDWAQFQVMAAQMTKNAKAQMALMKLFFQTQEEDPKRAAEVAAAYQEVGAVTAAIKAARAAALQQQTSARKRALDYRAGIVKMQRAKRLQQLEKTYAQYYAQMGKIGAKANQPQYAAQVASLQQKMTAAQEQIAAAKAAIKEENDAQVAAAEAAMQGPPALQGFDGFGSIASRPGSIPYCEIVTRDAYGPTCVQASDIDMGGGRLAGLGDMGAWYDVVGRVTAGVFTGGASELALNVPASGALKGEVSKIGQASSWFSKNVTCPVTNKLSGSKDLAKAGGAAELAVAATSGICGAAAKKAALAQAEADAKAGVVKLPEERGMHERDVPWWASPGTMLGLAVVAGGIIGGVVLATRAPERKSGTAGFGRLPSRRRRGRR
jgi:hypothetical protein